MEMAKIKPDISFIQSATACNTRSNKMPSSIYLLFFLLVIDLIGFTIILPLLPSIFDFYASNEQDHLYHWIEVRVRNVQVAFGSPDTFSKVLFAGFLGSVYSGLQFLVAPIIGSFSDVYGRKPVYILSTVGFLISHIVWYYSDHFYLFILARIIGGLSRSNISLSVAIVTDLCPGEKRGKGMASIGIAFAVGFIVGPMIGAYFSLKSAHDYGSKLYVFPAQVAIMTTLIELVLFTLLFEETLPLDQRAPSVGQGLKKAYQFISPVSLFSFAPVLEISSKDKKHLRQVGLTYFLFLFLYSGLEYSLSFLTHTRFNFTSMQQGQMYFISGVFMVLVQGGYTRRIKPGSELKAAAVGTLLIIPGFILIGISRSVKTFYVGLMLYSYASATVVPCLTTVASRFGSSRQKGTVLGIFRSLGYLARAFGPFASSVAYWSLTPDVSYTLGGTLIVIPLVLIWDLKNKIGTANKKD